jgi:mono/diheme cytochrome c family protein
MRIRARSVLLGLLIVVVVAVLGAITAVGWEIVLGPKIRPVTGRKFEVTPTRLARGRYLAEAAPCFHCHSEHDVSTPEYPRIEAKKGAGWRLPAPELNNISARNITPDPETGIGLWSDDEIARAIREGVDNKGEALFPIMPYMHFRNMSDEDVESIVVYLRTLPPVRNVVEKRHLPFPLNVLVNTMPKPLTTPVPGIAATATDTAKGEYLVQAIAVCGECHTPTDNQGQPLPGMAFGGGGSFFEPLGGRTVFSMNITPDPSGIAHYDEAMFKQTLRTGRLAGRMLSHVMPFENFRNFTDEDLHDIFAYIRTLPPVQHRISNTDTPTRCPLDGEMHGLGELNTKKS